MGPTTHALQSRDYSEATAVIRRTGAWSVYPGERGVLSRFYQRRDAEPGVEQRLGMVATCIGQLLTAALAREDIECQMLRVLLRSSRLLRPGARARSEAALVGHISVECEADPQSVEDCCERRVRRDPLFVLLTREFHSVEIKVETHARLHQWIC